MMLDAMIPLALPMPASAMPAGAAAPGEGATGPLAALPGLTAPGTAPSAFAQLLEAEHGRIDLALAPESIGAALPGTAAVIGEPVSGAPEADAAPTAPSAADASLPLPLPAPDPALLAQLALPAAPAAPAAEWVPPDGARSEALLSTPMAPARRPTPASAERSGEAFGPMPDATAMARSPVVPFGPAILPWTAPQAGAAGTIRRAAPRDETLPPAALAALGAARPHEPLAPVAAASGAGDTNSIAAPVDSPDFAPELAARVSVLARDGVQRAELRLNPVELGPMAVQIAIDGAQARIDFGAEAAATRSAIEASMPALAAALRDAGLTLAGGGVSQHMPGHGERRDGAVGGDTTGRGDAARADRTAEPMPARPASRLVRAGGVDLYA